MTIKHLIFMKFFGATIFLIVFSVLFLSDAFIIYSFFPWYMFMSHKVFLTIINLFVAITTTILCIITLCALSKRILGRFCNRKILIFINILTAISFMDMLLAVLIAHCV